MRAMWLGGVALALAAPLTAQTPAPQSATLAAVRAEGNKVFLTLPAPGADGVAARYLYVTTLRSGLGSAPLALDRAAFGPTQLVAFRRIGGKVAIQFENPRFRATGAPAAEQAAARDSFAFTTAWAGDIAQTLPDGRIVVDISGFLTRDAAGIAAQLEQGGAKGFRQVDNLSIVDPASLKVFPDNIEVEALQTFRSDTPGEEIANIAPDPRQISFTVHHSFVRLPGPGYVPRKFDGRAGGFASQAIDFAVPLGGDVVYDLANRFRLEKTDPTAARSPVKKPIVFYVDRAAPEPIRSALLDGVRWWADAFDKAGFIGGFRAEILPEGVDPMDVRYNVVNWVNRATRGWSYGQVVADPRTGEIVKGSVLLGSLRVRQDMLIFEGLVGSAKVNTGGPNDPVQAALARLRQLAAHEVGHALGLVHNFAASTQDRGSVLDYPAPRIGLVDGKPDLSDAYGVGLGAWDRFAIDWAYGQPAPGVDPDAAAKAKADAMVASGMRFVSDGDARVPGAGQPWGSLWDDGADPVAELNRMMQVRAAALANFGMGALRPGEPMANLRRKFVPIWLLHRYQLEAAAKFVGGVDYGYAVAGDAMKPALPVPADRQRAALSAIAATLDPAALTVRSDLLPLLSQEWGGNTDRQFDIEVMATAGGPVFDPLVAADTAATFTLQLLLNPQRLARLQRQRAGEASQLGVADVLDLVERVAARRGNELERRIAYRALLSLAQLSLAKGTDVEIAALAGARLQRIADTLVRSGGPWERGVGALLNDRDRLAAEVERSAKTPPVPPGMPIGGASTGGWIDE
jgi:hypothetical protein